MNEDDKAKLAIMAIAAASLLWFFMCLYGCKTQYIPGNEVHTKDSANISVRVDTFIHHTRDSIVTKLPCSDTIEVAYVDRWHYERITEKQIKNDTIRVASNDSIPVIVEVEKEVVRNSWFAKFCIWLVILGAIAAAATIAYKVIKRIYIR